MPIHLRLLDDSVEELLNAYRHYAWLKGHQAGRQVPIRLGQCVRSFYISLEKAFKYRVINIDPYLLVSRPNADLLLQLRKDIIARPVPTILCSRQPFETPNMVESWKLARTLHGVDADADVFNDFERLLNELGAVRHRAQHSEVFDELAPALATIEQLFGALQPILNSICPQLLVAAYRRNGQLESRLASITNRIDSAWQVLVDYLRTGHEATIHATMTVIQDGTSGTLQVLFAKPEDRPTRSYLMAGVTATAGDATGLFSTFLTPEAAEARAAARTAQGKESPTQQGSVSSLLNLLAVRPTSKVPLPPLDTGELRLPRAYGVINVRLSGMGPSKLVLPSVLTHWRIAVEDPAAPAVVQAFVHAPRSPTDIALPIVAATGSASLVEEWALGPDDRRALYKAGATYRSFALELRLITGQIVSLAQAPSPVHST